MHYVIGSGPAGVACAQALRARGLGVRMVDAGLTLEPEIQARVAALGAKPPGEWNLAEVARLKGPAEASRKGIVLKRSFGSDFPYRGASQHLGIWPVDAALKPSLAMGGLSNVWGAAMLPCTSGDLEGWPLRVEDLAPHYAAVLRLTGLAARRDSLEPAFPLYAEQFAALRMGGQARRLWQRLERHRAHLEAAGIHFGAARLAVRDCNYCGLCMDGCPYGYIYNSAATVRQLQRETGFDYEPGVIVSHLRETGGEVRLEGARLPTGEPWTARADRVFLAAGVLPTTKILLASQDAYDRPCIIKDSQYFLFPLAQFGRTPGVREEPAYTLSQIFLEITDPALSRRTVHVQIYGYNDLIGPAIRGALGPLGADWIVRRIEERMLIAQAYLHSDHSSQIRVVLEKTPAGAQLRMDPEIASGAAPLARQVVRKLLRQAAHLGAVPLEPLLQLAPPGRGFHSGGTFPMRQAPAPFETDLLGRPHGWERVHAVDSSIFPSIPATTITLTVMANAHRIGTSAAA